MVFLDDQLRKIREDDLINTVVQLPEAQRQEVIDFAEYLLDKYLCEKEIEEMWNYYAHGGKKDGNNERNARKADCKIKP